MTLRRRLLPWIASSLLLAAACDRGASAPAPETPAIGEERGRVVIVGIDGATLRVIEPMMARG